MHEYIFWMKHVDTRPHVLMCLYVHNQFIITLHFKIYINAFIKFIKRKIVSLRYVYFQNNFKAFRWVSTILYITKRMDVLLHNMTDYINEGVMNTCDIRLTLHIPTASIFHPKYLVIEMCQNQYSRSIKFVWLQTITSFY